MGRKTLQAAEIEAEPGFLVIAIGRFQIITDLLASHTEYPWCITAISQCNPSSEAPAKICNRNDWMNYRHVSRRPRSSPASQPEKAAKRRDDAHMRQPTLF